MTMNTQPTPATNARRIYIANDDHTDYMWSADADTYHQVFIDLLDFHLQLADETAGSPPPFRARFNADGNFWRLAWARRTFEAQLATHDLAQKLGVEEGVPLFCLEQISYLEDGCAIECSDVWLRGDRFKLSSILTRDGRLPRAGGAESSKNA